MTNLHMGSKRPLKEWIMSFERTNLRFSVQKKAGSIASCMAPVVAVAARAKKQGAQPEATLVYALTTAEVDSLCEHLQAQGLAAVR